MKNPTITKKVDSSFVPTEDAKRLFQAIYQKQNAAEKQGEEVPVIKVSELVSRMAFYYEKIRNSVDYKEDNLLRKNAIERILKRQIVIEGAVSLRDVDSREVSKHLLVELIRAGYLPNNKIPETKIGEIAVVVERYLKLKRISADKINLTNIKEKNELINWIIAMAATDIEERVGMSKADKVVIDYMYDVLEPNIKLPENSKYDKDREIQIYVAIHRNFFRFDKDMIGFILLKYFIADWENAGDDKIEDLAKNINALRESINNQIDHALAPQLNRIVSRYTVFFTILIDTIEDDCVGIYDCFGKDPKVFPRHIKRICEARYKMTKKRLWRAAIRSLLYVFLTKSVFAFALEVPVIKWFGEEVNMFSLAINIGFPVLLLFLIVIFTKTPSIENSLKVVEGIEEIVFEEKKRTEPFQLRHPGERGGFMNTVFGIFYTITIFLSFGAVVWILNEINFNFVSIIIFLFFLALISFFSIRIRKGIKELMVLPPKENILSFFADFFYVPIVTTGKWLSEKFSRLNVFVFILDFIIEAPFKIFVEITEEWTKYVKERKDNIS